MAAARHTIMPKGAAEAATPAPVGAVVEDEDDEEDEAEDGSLPEGLSSLGAAVVLPVSALPAEVVDAASVAVPERTPVSMVVPAAAVVSVTEPDLATLEVLAAGLEVLAMLETTLDASEAAVVEAADEAAVVEATASGPKPGRKVGEYWAVPL
jgi:hypothetical protein